MRHPYEQLIDEFELLPEWEASAAAFKQHYEKNKAVYEEVYAHTNVPPEIVAVINMMECGGRLDRHLANGDPLTARTKQVPAGLPKEGNPPFTFLQGAVAALEYDKMNLHPWGEDVTKDLAKLEAYNGMGYKKRDMDSPYIVNGSNFTTKGKFVADGKFDPNATSKQLGVLPMLMVVGYFEEA